jgi:[ribosomal protein S5]-alanine N-acetyltransferase
VIRARERRDDDDVLVAIRYVAGRCQDPEIARFTVLIPSPYTANDALLFIQEARRKWEESEEATFVIENRETEEFCGIVSVELRDGGSVGYWVKPEARGKGIATDAVWGAVSWAREEHEIERFFLKTHPANVAPQRVAEKANFRKVGVVSQTPAFRDRVTEAVLYELAYGSSFEGPFEAP